MTDTRPDRGTTAAEYALGLLSGAALRDARAKAASDPAFAHEVARWTGRLAPLLDEAEAVPAPASIWARIDRAIGAPASGGNVIALRRKVTVWRGFAGAMTALAASLAVVVVNRPVPPPPPAVPAPAAEQPMVAMLASGADVAAVANWNSNARQLLVSEVRMPVVPGRDYQLWVIPADGTPRSLGVMPSVPHMRVAVAEPLSAMLAAGATLAVSLEPRGGSPTAAPTGPVVASGTLSAA